MQISMELLNGLFSVIREMERSESAIKWSHNKEIFETQLLLNEFYFAEKIKNQNMKKIKFYEQKILGEPTLYQDLFCDIEKRCTLREFNSNFISEIQGGLGMESYEINNLDAILEKKLDHLINASELYRKVYIEFPNNDFKKEFSSVVTNSYLKKNDVAKHMLLSEAINSNIVVFNSSVLEEEKFILMFIRLMQGQLKKNNMRMDNTVELINEKKYLLEKYDDKIQEYLYKEVVFTISDFVAKNGISYNTGKKYLLDLIQKGILVPTKIGKHNAFIYQDMYNIWVK